MCQSPIYRDTHFYEQGEELWKMLKCVNPLSIGTPISTHSRASVAPVIPHLRVNPLSIGTPISTVRPKERWIATLTCVNPLSIGTPISTHSNSNRGGIGITVSIPYPSGHPFLRFLLPWRESIMAKCVNPLSIGTPISTSVRLETTMCQRMCQSPIHRDTHFYPHPQNCLILCGLPASILQVFIRQFWQRACFWVFNTFVIIFGTFLKLRKLPLARLSTFPIWSRFWTLTPYG